MSIIIAMIGHKRIPGRESGVEVVVQQLSTRLVARGYEVDAFNRKNKNVPKEEYFQGVHLVTVPTIDKKSLDAPVYAIMATLKACFHRYDVLHYHAEGSCIALWLCKLFGKRVVVTIHGLDWQRAKWGALARKVIKFAEQQAVKHADEIIVLSRNVQEYFKKEYNRETVFIPNGVDRPNYRDDAVISKEYGVKKNKYFLYLGRIVPEKGLDYLVDAYKQVKTDMPLVIAGGSSHTDEYYASLKKRAKEDKRIIFTGHVEGELLDSLFSNTYAYLFPSDLEGMPISLLEAMSYGNCCLVSDIPENIEVVEDKALSFMKSDVEDLRDKLRYMLDHPEKVETLKAAASDFICNKYNWDRIVDQTLEIYLR